MWIGFEIYININSWDHQSIRGNLNLDALCLKYLSNVTFQNKMWNASYWLFKIRTPGTQKKKKQIFKYCVAALKKVVSWIIILELHFSIFQIKSMLVVIKTTWVTQYSTFKFKQNQTALSLDCKKSSSLIEERLRISPRICISNTRFTEVW